MYAQKRSIGSVASPKQSAAAACAIIHRAESAETMARLSGVVVQRRRDVRSVIGCATPTTVTHDVVRDGHGVRHEQRRHVGREGWCCSIAKTTRRRREDDAQERARADRVDHDAVRKLWGPERPRWLFRAGAFCSVGAPSRRRWWYDGRSQLRFARRGEARSSSCPSFKPIASNFELEFKHVCASNEEKKVRV
jgi:hypothetical protein